MFDNDIVFSKQAVVEKWLLAYSGKSIAIYLYHSLPRLNTIGHWPVYPSNVLIYLYNLMFLRELNLR